MEVDVEFMSQLYYINNTFCWFGLDVHAVEVVYYLIVIA